MVTDSLTDSQVVPLGSLSRSLLVGLHPYKYFPKNYFKQTVCGWLFVISFWLTWLRERRVIIDYFIFWREELKKSKQTRSTHFPSTFWQFLSLFISEVISEVKFRHGKVQSFGLHSEEEKDWLQQFLTRWDFLRKKRESNPVRKYYHQKCNSFHSNSCERIHVKDVLKFDTKLVWVQTFLLQKSSKEQKTCQ